MYNMQETTQYWWSYASAKFCLDSCHRSIELRRTITSSILICWHWLLYWHVFHDSIYRLCDRGVSKQRGQESSHNIVAWCKINYVYVHNTLILSKRTINQLFFYFMIAHVSIKYQTNFCVRNQRGRVPYLSPTKVVPPWLKHKKDSAMWKKVWSLSGRRQYFCVALWEEHYK